MSIKFVAPVDERILIGIDASRLMLAARADSFGRQ